MAKRIAAALLRLAVVLGLCAALAAGWSALENREPLHDAEFLFVGTEDDADCAIFLSAGSCVMVDTGEAVDAAHIAEVLAEHGVETIDCLILTHPDKDHVGGARALAEQFEVRQVVVPYFAGEKSVYRELMDELERKNIPVLTLYRDRQFLFGELDIRVFPPEDFYYEESNDYSLAILLKHGQTRVFMAGDAEKTRLKEILKLDLPAEVELYKAARHGRSSGKGVELIERLRPQNTVVTARQAGNKIQKALEEAGSAVFCTVGQDVSFVSDGSGRLTVKETRALK